MTSSIWVDNHVLKSESRRSESEGRSQEPDTVECVLASANPHKIEEVRAILEPFGWVLRSAHELGIVEEIPETGSTLEENARQKALHVARLTARPSLADDTGLEVDFLDGAPGVYSARYAGLEASYQDNVDLLLQRMSGVPHPQRQARFRTVIALARPDRIELEASGALEGRIVDSPRGSGGFGYDPIFEPNGGDRTLAELDPEEKNRISHRARALEAFLALLRKNDSSLP